MWVWFLAQGSSQSSQNSGLGVAQEIPNFWFFKTSLFNPILKWTDWTASFHCFGVLVKAMQWELVRKDQLSSSPLAGTSQLTQFFQCAILSVSQTLVQELDIVYTQHFCDWTVQGPAALQVVKLQAGCQFYAAGMHQLWSHLLGCQR